MPSHKIELTLIPLPPARPPPTACGAVPLGSTARPLGTRRAWIVNCERPKHSAAVQTLHPCPCIPPFAHAHRTGEPAGYGPLLPAYPGCLSPPSIYFPSFSPRLVRARPAGTFQHLPIYLEAAVAPSFPCVTTGVSPSSPGRHLRTGLPTLRPPNPCRRCPPAWAARPLPYPPSCSHLPHTRID
jgi:hypothetical protein